MSATNQTTCPNCGQSIEFDIIYSGEESECPTCGSRFRLPDLPADLPRRHPPRKPNPAIFQPVKPVSAWGEYVSAFFLILLPVLPGAFSAPAFFLVLCLLILPAAYALGALGEIAKRLREIETTLKNRP